SFNDEHLWAYRWMLRVQHLVGRITPTRLLPAGLRMLDSPRFVDWAFQHYLEICPPQFALDAAADAGLAAPPQLVSA
ncbi:MAG: hypothetical protein QOF69_484, partial [Solirubrobacteraceae bacterium]|nr:hypothetical protein [Solirubrobacteraceae bacterium]